MNVLKSYYAYLGIAAGIVIKLAMLGSTALYVRIPKIGIRT